MRSITLAAILLGGMTHAAHTDENYGPTTVHQLAEYCMSDPYGARGGFCLGFISSVMEMLSFTNHIAMGKYKSKEGLGLDICASDTKVTMEQIEHIFILWHNNNPKFWNDDAAVGVVIALQTTWPCK
jgi:hypothetical protein